MIGYFGSIESNVLYLQFQESINIMDSKYQRDYVMRNYDNYPMPLFYLIVFVNIFKLNYCHSDIRMNGLSPNKHNDVTLSQCQTIGCMDFVSLFEMKLLPTSVGNVVALLRSDVVATLWQRRPTLWQRYKFVTLESSCNIPYNIFSTLCQLCFS